MFKIIEILVAIGLVFVCSGCSIEHKAAGYQKQMKSERNTFQNEADYEIEADEYYHVIV